MAECKHEHLDKIFMGGKMMNFCATCGQVIAPIDSKSDDEAQIEVKEQTTLESA